MSRKHIPVPKHHYLVPNLLIGISGIGLPFVAWGLWKLEIWPLLLGTSFVYAGKVWFLDRMVWLYEDMKDKAEEYSLWHYSKISEPVVKEERE